jgi:hypothetical protein
MIVKKRNLVLLSIEKFENAPCIFIYRNALKVGNFIELVEDEASKSWPYLLWMQSSTGDGVKDGFIGDYRTSLEMSMGLFLSEDINEDLKDLKDKFIENILTPLNECIWDYRNFFDLSLKTETGYSLLKYTGGSEYHIHHDHGSENERVLSMVACLGEDDFEGGELEFNNFNLTVKLNKDDVILFPSNFPYTHIAHPVDNGVKYSLVTWFV